MSDTETHQKKSGFDISGFVVTKVGEAKDFARNFDIVKFVKDYKIRLGLAAVSLIVMQLCISLIPLDPAWYMLLYYEWILICLAPINNDPEAFFMGKTRNQAGEPEHVGFLLLTASVHISWIFAKSIYNTSTLAGSFGFVGCIAYGAYWVALYTASVTSYYLRTRHGATTVTEAVRKCYGSVCVVLYLVFIVYRLNFEVWSNTAVVASFFVPNGVIQTDVWWWVCFFAAAAPMIYVCMGGFRASLTTDVLQAFLHFILLFIIMGYSFGGMPGGGANIFTFGARWTLEGGMDLFCVGLLQGFISYPFFDPILMDRTFLSTPKTMVASFFTAATFSMVFIWFFGTLGVYGRATVGTGNPATVAHHIGESVFLVVTLIMMSSQLTAVDSCFVSTGRVICIDLVAEVKTTIPWLYKGVSDVYTHLTKDVIPADGSLGLFHIRLARLSIFLMALCGTLPLIQDATVLNATTVSGTIIMGCGPPILLMIVWKDSWGQRPMVFISSWVAGVVLGIMFQYQVCVPGTLCTIRNMRSVLWNRGWEIGRGSYALLLGVNLYGILICWGLCAFFFFAYDAFSMASGRKIKPCPPCMVHGGQDLEALQKSVAPEAIEMKVTVDTTPATKPEETAPIKPLEETAASPEIRVDKPEPATQQPEPAPQQVEAAPQVEPQAAAQPTPEPAQCQAAPEPAVARTSLLKGGQVPEAEPDSEPTGTSPEAPTDPVESHS